MPQQPQQQLTQELQSAGAHDPKHESAAREAQRAGFSVTEIIGWVREYGPEVLDLVQLIVGRLHGGGTPPPRQGKVVQQPNPGAQP